MTVFGLVVPPADGVAVSPAASKTSSTKLYRQLTDFASDVV